MPRIQITDLPVTAELRQDEIQEIRGGFQMGTSSPTTENGIIAILIGLVDPAAQKVSPYSQKVRGL